MYFKFFIFKIFRTRNVRSTVEQLSWSMWHWMSVLYLYRRFSGVTKHWLPQSGSGESEMKTLMPSSDMRPELNSQPEELAWAVILASRWPRSWRALWHSCHLRSYKYSGTEIIVFQWLHLLWLRLKQQHSEGVEKQRHEACTVLSQVWCDVWCVTFISSELSDMSDSCPSIWQGLTLPSLKTNTWGGSFEAREEMLLSRPGPPERPDH